MSCSFILVLFGFEYGVKDILFSGQKTGGQELIGGLDCTVHRNYFGSQVTGKFVPFELNCSMR